MSEKKEKLTGVTPVGEFIYPHLTRVDYGTEQHPKPNGDYNVKVALTEEEAAPLLCLLGPAHAQAIKAGQHEYDALPLKQREQFAFKTQPLHTPEYNADGTERTGRILFNFKSVFSGEIKNGPRKGERWERQLPLFNADGSPIDPKKTFIRGGSRGQVAFSYEPYFTLLAGAGLSLRIEAVMVNEFAVSERKATDFGFGVQAPAPSNDDLPSDNDDAGVPDHDDF